MAQSITDLKVGRVVKIGDEPYVITSNSFMRTAQRKPVMRTKLRNVKTGKALDKTFVSGENFDIVHIEKTNSQYLYKDTESVYFMDSQTFEQFSITLALIGDQINYLKEGQDTVVTTFEGSPIGLELPPKVALEIIDTPPGVKGDTATGGTKPATLETGFTVQVPLFLNIGEKIRVNTETGEYVERA
ncbi:MAG: elongation factor P [Patescibacteria group bacterium]